MVPLLGLDELCRALIVPPDHREVQEGACMSIKRLLQSRVSMRVARYACGHHSCRAVESRAVRERPRSPQSTEDKICPIRRLPFRWHSRGTALWFGRVKLGRVNTIDARAAGQTSCCEAASYVVRTSRTGAATVVPRKAPFIAPQSTSYFESSRNGRTEWGPGPACHARARDTCVKAALSRTSPTM